MINQSSVDLFKRKYCDENTIIARLLRDELKEWATDNILDAGCGMGDISAEAFNDRMVILLDRLDYSSYPTATLHKRITMDFYDYSPDPDSPITTILFSHVMQFMDDDLEKLAAAVKKLSPRRVIMVTNINDGFMSDLIHWSRSALPGCNPEIDVAEFPSGFICEKEARFAARLACPDFGILAEQVCYLLDIKAAGEELQRVFGFLRESLTEPHFQIHQRIRVFTNS